MGVNINLCNNPLMFPAYKTEYVNVEADNTHDIINDNHGLSVISL